MKAFLLLDMPDNCLKCKISHYEVDDSKETLLCPLLETEGSFLERLPGCPLKGLEE